MSDQSADGIERETHIDDELGLFIPKGLREFTSQIVFRTPRATIQHFGSQPLDGYYGMIHADQFGDPDEMRDPKNPELAPDRVKIKPQGEDAVTLTVETEPEIRTDGGTEWSYEDPRCGASVPLSVRRGGATQPQHKVELSGNGTSYRGHAAPYECQDCGNVQWFVTSQFRFMSDCHDCGRGSFFEFDFELARSLSPATDHEEVGGDE